jgi:sulfite oxidase
VIGYATAGGHRRVASVEVSADGGETWRAAELLDRPAPGEWSRWRAVLDLGAGEHELVARARDSDGRAQPRQPAERWNPKGYLNDAWHRVRLAIG